jgi:hypothetical protein
LTLLAKPSGLQGQFANIFLGCEHKKINKSVVKSAQYMLPPENIAKTTGDYGDPQFKFDKNERIFYMRVG